MANLYPGIRAMLVLFCTLASIKGTQCRYNFIETVHGDVTCKTVHGNVCEPMHEVLAETLGCL